jgi:hypothetical protein
MGLLIAFEGVIVMVMARRVEFRDAFVLDQMVVLVLGVILFVLGMLLFIPIFPQLQKMSEWLAKRMQIVAALGAMLYALVFLLVAAPVEMEGLGGMGKGWVVLAAGQLIFLATMAFVFMYYEPLSNRRLAWLEWLGTFASALVITLGAIIFGMRGDLNIHGVLRGGPEIMVMVGVVLIALGILEIVIFNRRREGESEKLLGILDWAGIGVSVIIGVIGLVMLILTTSISLDGRTYGVYWMLMVSVSLALLGPILDYTQTVVAGKEGWNMDLGLISTLILLLAIPFAAAF